MSDSLPTPLQGDPKRRANDSIRGYEYQVWVSVDQWTALTEDEVLYLEAAEDFEVTIGEASRTTQVKDTPGKPISLNTEAAATAVENFLLIVAKNPVRTVRYSYLTTAGATVELDAPFGADVPGISVWRQCAREPYSPALYGLLSSIRSVLARRATAGSHLQAAVGEPLEAFYHRVIVPFTWATDEPSADTVRAQVHERLVNHLARASIPAGEAPGIEEALFTEAIKVAASKEPTPLRRSRLLEIIDARTRLQLPRALLEPLLAALAGVGPAAPAALQIGASVGQLHQLPPLPASLFRRGTIEDAALALLETRGFLNVTGSMGAGKTTLVRCLVDRLGDRRTIWLRLRSAPAQSAAAQLTFAHGAVLAAAARSVVVLDDLELRGDTRVFEEALAALARAIRERTGLLVASTYTRLPARLSGLAGWAGDAFPVPALEVDEIAGFLRQRGAPSEDAARALLIKAETGGHPQLVVIKLAELERAGFPPLTPGEVIGSSPGIRDARAEARRLLSNTADAASRDLVYRLSLCGVPFSREVALAIAEGPPPLPRPGEAFDSVDGVWLESVESGLYGVSPLVQGVATEALGPQDVRRTHAMIGRTYIGRSSISVQEAADMLVHAVQAGAESGALARWLWIGLCNAPQEVTREFALRSMWFISMDHFGDGLDAPDRTARESLRIIQLNIAVWLESPSLPRVVSVVERDLRRSDPSTFSTRTMFLLQVVSLATWPMSLRDGVNWLAELLATNVDATVLQKIDLRAFAWTAMARQINTTSHVAELLFAIDRVPHSRRPALFGTELSDDGPLRTFFDRLWLEAHDRADDGLRAAIRVCDEAANHAASWGVGAVARAAARCASVILDEGLKNRASARVRVTECIERWGTTPLLEDQLAVLSFHDGNFGDALDRWEGILPRWHPEKQKDPKGVLSSRLAAIAAARLGDFGRSARYFGEAATRTVGLLLPRALRVGLQADAAYAAWLGGDRAEAVDRLTDVVRAVAALEPRNDQLHSCWGPPSLALTWPLSLALT